MSYTLESVIVQPFTISSYHITLCLLWKLHHFPVVHFILVQEERSVEMKKGMIQQSHFNVEHQNTIQPPIKWTKFLFYFGGGSIFCVTALTVIIMIMFDKNRKEEHFFFSSSLSCHERSFCMIQSLHSYSQERWKKWLEDLFSSSLSKSFRTVLSLLLVVELERRFENSKKTPLAIGNIRLSV